MGILTRIWKGNFVYQEPICFSEDAEGHIAGGQLLYQPEHILSVTSFDGSVFYEEGTDYIREDSRLILTEHSRIPILSRDIYCKPSTGWRTLHGSRLRCIPLADTRYVYT